METKSRKRTRVRVADGIYQDPKTKRFCHRPKVNGKWTFRVLAAPTLKVAREELAAIRTDRVRVEIATGRDPLVQISSGSISEILNKYERAGCPDRKLRQSGGRALSQDLSRLKHLRAWNGWSAVEAISQRTLDRYYEYRQRVSKRPSCARAVDLEINTLKRALGWACRLEYSSVNPFDRFKPIPFGKSGAEMVHCRERMPGSAEDLHALAQNLFEGRDSEVLGWQLLFQAYTGCRTQEVLELRIDGMSERNAGFVEDGILYLNRAKHGINNWVRIHPDLRELLRVHRCWLAARYPSSPWYLPSPKNAFKSVNHDSLTHALRRLAPLIVGYPVTAHSLRAYFVTVRRSHGVGDAEIALEIGQVSGGREIVKTYGESRPKKLGWKSEEGEQAWVVFRALEKVVPMAGKRATA